ncbi:MAG TPA: allose kinase, partial [Clostridia bacterium]|nr:allose kinase [Clostridia bacterium]
MVTIGMDIGGTHIRTGAVGRDGGLSCFETVLQKEILSRTGAAESLAAYLNAFVRRHGLEKQVAALGAGLPATLSKDKDTVLSAPNIEGLDGIPLRDALQERLGLPVFLLKDVSALFAYDRNVLPVQGVEVALACYVGTGIGNAICLNGKIFEGENGSAGELGHIPVRGFSEPCGCGNSGCAEVFCGGRYLAALRAEAFPDTPMEALFERHADHPLLKDYIERLALPIAAEVNILDPGALILGGGVISMRGFPLEAL